ncbi:hypothetical protein ACTXT7_002819 [Hymenolepis weldensis]
MDPLEMELEKRHQLYKVETLPVCSRLEGENSQDIPMELLQRILNYSLITIEEQWTDSDDDSIDGDGIIDYMSSSASSHADAGGYRNNSNGKYDYGWEAYNDACDDTRDTDDSNGSDVDVDYTDTYGSGSEEDDDTDFDSFEISFCLKILKIMFDIDRVYVPLLSWMSESESEEVCPKISYNQSLIKCTAKINLTKDCPEEWSTERKSTNFPIFVSFIKQTEMMWVLLELYRNSFSGV